jgi:hypothetical protein
LLALTNLANAIQEIALVLDIHWCRLVQWTRLYNLHVVVLVNADAGVFDRTKPVTNIAAQCNEGMVWKRRRKSSLGQCFEKAFEQL